MITNRTLIMLSAAIWLQQLLRQRPPTAPPSSRPLQRLMWILRKRTPRGRDEDMAGRMADRRLDDMYDARGMSFYQHDNQWTMNRIIAFGPHGGGVWQ